MDRQGSLLTWLMWAGVGNCISIPRRPYRWAQTGWFNTTAVYALIVLEARSLKSRCSAVLHPLWRPQGRRQSLPSSSFWGLLTFLALWLYHFHLSAMVTLLPSLSLFKNDVERVLGLRLSSCGTRAPLLHGGCDLLGLGIEPMSPALAGRVFTTESPGKPTSYFLTKSLWQVQSYCLVANPMNSDRVKIPMILIQLYYLHPSFFPTHTQQRPVY